MEFKYRLRDLRRENNWSAKELGEKVGRGESTISMWENGKSFPNFATQEKLAKLFGVSKSYLLGETNDRDALTIKETTNIDGWQTVPVYKQISCGEGCFCDDEIIDYVAVPSNIVRNKDCFAVPANGDSMINIGINDGDTLIFKKTEAYEDNDIVAVCIDTEEIALCKRVKVISDESILLMSENNKYSPILIDKNKKGCHFK